MAESKGSTPRASGQRTDQAIEQQHQGQPQGSQLNRREENQAVLTPFGFMRRFSEDMDRLFEDFIRNPFGLTAGRAVGAGMQGAWTPNIEVFQRDSDFVVRAELPGLNKDDVHVELNDDMLTISGERRQEREENRGGVYHSERSYGSFSRSIPLPEGAIGESAQATFKNGVLEITLQAPPAHGGKGRQLEIK